MMHSRAYLLLLFLCAAVLVSGCGEDEATSSADSQTPTTTTSVTPPVDAKDDPAAAYDAAVAPLVSEWSDVLQRFRRTAKGTITLEIEPSPALVAFEQQYSDLVRIHAKAEKIRARPAGLAKAHKRFVAALRGYISVLANTPRLANAPSSAAQNAEIVRAGKALDSANVHLQAWSEYIGTHAGNYPKVTEQALQFQKDVAAAFVF